MPDELLVAGIRWGPVGGRLVLGSANPMAWVAIAAVFGSSHLADAAATDAASKIGVLTTMLVVICGTGLVAGASIAPLLREPRRARIVNVTLAMALVGATALAVVH